MYKPILFACFISIINISKACPKNQRVGENGPLF